MITVVGIDKPQISIALVQEALAAYLRQYAGAVNVYRNPNQQDTELPCWFVNLMPPSGIEKAVGNRYWRTFGFDLCYMEQFNLPDLYNRYIAKAEILDETLGLLAYPYMYQKKEDSEPEQRYAYIHTSNRQWVPGLDMLHYRFEVQLRVSRTFDDNAKMMVIEELHEFVKEVMADGETIYQEW